MAVLSKYLNPSEEMNMLLETIKKLEKAIDALNSRIIILESASLRLERDLRQLEQQQKQPNIWPPYPYIPQPPHYSVKKWQKP